MSSRQRIPVFVISLARAPERRAAVCAHLQSLGIEHEVVDAVDGRAMSADEMAKLVAPGRSMHPGAVGCYLSHVAVYERMRDRSLEVALVLEDDARAHPRIARLVSEGCASLDWDYCFLDSDDHNTRGPVFYDADSGQGLGVGFTAYTLSSGPQTTHAYMITRPAALRRLEHAYPLREPVDLYWELPYAIHFTAVVGPKGAWVSEHSLQSFTSAKSGSVDQLSLAALRRWPIFYRLRDLIRLKDLRRNWQVRRLKREGLLDRQRRWKALPSGREIVLDREQAPRSPSFSA